MAHQQTKAADGGPPETTMWRHYCQAERTLMSIGRGEACNWCQAREGSALAPQQPTFFGGRLPDGLERLGLGLSRGGGAA